MTFNELEPKLDDFMALWLTIYGEASGEPIDGMVAVGNVIRNRNEETGETIKQVCLKGVDIYRHQFSCWNVDDPNLKRILEVAERDFQGKATEKVVQQLKWVTSGVLMGALVDNTRGSNHYLTSTLFHSNNCPKWAKGVNILAALGCLGKYISAPANIEKIRIDLDGLGVAA